ncbi:unnamed protein product [Urochloa decumbens]|uniref:Uncharacterized protein n=1 Tax=Urochloa decumbens TaxID=240449 RepID=A0ABC9F2C8_9POAL
MELAAAAMVLSNSGDPRAEYAHRPQRSSCGLPPAATHAEEFFLRKLARHWKRLVKSGKTTLAIARAYDSLGINEDSVKTVPFEDLVTSMRSPAVLQAAKALLDRLETRLVISHSPAEGVDHLLKHINNPPPRKATAPRNTNQRTARPAAAKRPATATSSGTATTTSGSASRYSPRVVLSAYMIVAHPGAVLSGQDDEGEKELMASAATFVGELEQLIKVILGTSDGQGRKFRDQLAGFDKAWCAYLYDFVAWKVKDARVLEDDLVRAACKLEVSMLQACKVAGDGAAPPEGELTHDMRAIRDQVAGDLALLRAKVRQLTGGAGVERMEAAVSDARSEYLEARKSGVPAAAPAVVANVSTPLSVGSPPASPAKQVTKENEKLVNDMLHHGVGDDLFGAMATDTTAEKDLEKRVREQMVNAFWDIVTESITGDKPDYSLLVRLVAEVRDFLKELSPNKKLKDEIADKIDIEILSQVLSSGSQTQNAQYLGQILQYSLDMVRKLSAAAKEDEMKKNHDKLLSELAASSEQVASGDNGVSSFAIAVSKGLRFVVEEIRELRAEVNKVRIEMAAQPILRGSAGVEYLQKAFANCYGPPANALASSLPLTLQFVSASKSVVEQEWREHSVALSALPSAGRAPGIVPVVLRAGHGAPVGQSSSSPEAASGDSDQPECKGDMLDKIVRIGLLQLISNMEELQTQSTPESFHLNLQRLKAVQCQFQRVIGIATSTLVLRQILMAESPKPTPAQLENAITELFEDLVKTLGSSPDAGAQQVVEAMIRASAAVGSPSEEKVQARRQVMGRVFVKSVQPGDTVFKMVSRAVHCAFRGVVLGGGGANGRKLADAALRHVGAARLTDTVVKAAEVAIRVATVSEKVHGPWYNALI